MSKPYNKRPTSWSDLGINNKQVFDEWPQKFGENLQVKSISKRNVQFDDKYGEAYRRLTKGGYPAYLDFNVARVWVPLPNNKAKALDPFDKHDNEFRGILYKCLISECGIDDPTIVRNPIIVTPFPQPIAIHASEEGDEKSYFGCDNALAYVSQIFSDIAYRRLPEEKKKIRLKKDTSLGIPFLPDYTAFDELPEKYRTTAYSIPENPINTSVIQNLSAAKKLIFSMVNTKENLSNWRGTTVDEALKKYGEGASVKGIVGLMRSIARINNIDSITWVNLLYGGYSPKKRSLFAAYDKVIKYFDFSQKDFLPWVKQTLERAGLDTSYLVVCRYRLVEMMVVAYNYYYIYQTKAVLNNIEDGVHHFPNNRPLMRKNYQDFVKDSDIDDVYVITMDQSQCDAQMSAAPHVALDWVPYHDWLYDLITNFVFELTLDGKLGLDTLFGSGNPYTTGGNFWFGCKKIARFMAALDCYINPKLDEDTLHIYYYIRCLNYFLLANGQQDKHYIDSATGEYAIQWGAPTDNGDGVLKTTGSFKGKRKQFSALLDKVAKRFDADYKIKIDSQESGYTISDAFGMIWSQRDIIERDDIKKMIPCEGETAAGQEFHALSCRSEKKRNLDVAFIKASAIWSHSSYSECESSYEWHKNDWYSGLLGMVDPPKAEDLVKEYSGAAIHEYKVLLKKGFKTEVTDINSLNEFITYSTVVDDREALRATKDNWDTLYRERKSFKHLSGDSFTPDIFTKDTIFSFIRKEAGIYNNQLIKILEEAYNVK